MQERREATAVAQDSVASQESQQPQAASAPKIYTVSRLNQQAMAVLERSFFRVTVVGEISNYKSVASGHRYFSLKDAGAQLPVALFRREASRIQCQLKDGLEVLVTGKLTIYPKTGRYQIIAEHVEARGAGALQAAFEALKKKLHSQGLFEEARKRPLPKVPGRVAVVTSRTGAVIRDIVNVATRRWPNAQILLLPAAVQGQAAAKEIVTQIERANAMAQSLGLDVLIVGRGGGSLEDLWCFNEESVAMAIAHSQLPVVSAVGHQTDFTIADFVADVRAPTPSAAAEMVFPRRSDWQSYFERRTQRLTHALALSLQSKRHHLAQERLRLGDSSRMTRQWHQRLSEALVRMETAQRQGLRRKEKALSEVQKRLTHAHPKSRFAALQEVFSRQNRRLATAMRERLGQERQQLVALGKGIERPLGQTLRLRRQEIAGYSGRLHALSPLAVLERGYAVVLDEKGHAVVDGKDVAVGDALSVRLARGELRARVEEVTQIGHKQDDAKD